FEKSKSSLREFEDILSSPAVQKWAAETGEKIGNAFIKVVDAVKGGIKWFSELDDKYKKIIGTTGAVVVAAGPLLTGFGILGGMIAKLSGGLGMFLKVLAPIVTPMKALGSAAVGSSTGFGLLKSTFVALTGPIGLTVSIITALVAGFTIAYAKSESFRKVIAKIKDAFLSAVSGIKEFLTTNETLLSAVDSIKNGFNIMKDNVKLAIGAVITNISEKVTQMKDYWNAEGQSILEATQNVFGAIWSVIEPIINSIVKLVKFAFPYIKKTIEIAMKLTKAIIQSVWENIKGVIDGALNVIMGLVKTFSGLFTGDFSKMWEGIKQVFSGALKFIWNYVQLMLWGKMLKGILSLGKLMINAFKSMWSGIRNVFSTVVKWIVDFVKNRFTSMKNTITNITTAIRN